MTPEKAAQGQSLVHCTDICADWLASVCSGSRSNSLSPIDDWKGETPSTMMASVCECGWDHSADIGFVPGSFLECHLLLWSRGDGGSFRLNGCGSGLRALV